MSALRIPAALGRFAWRFLNPKRTAGRVPLGRLAIAVQVIAALIFAGYTLSKKSVRLPWVSGDRYVVQVIFPDAKGLDPADNPAAAVAGTPEGQVTSVRYESGRAIATLSLDPSVRGKLFADATAELRPASALQNLLVNVDPGTPAAGPLPDGQPIPPDRTSSFVAIDELTGILDADTQAYVSILLQEADAGLHGRAGGLRGALAELGNLTDPATAVARALARRRQELTRLVGELDVIFTTLGRRGAELASAIDAGDRTLAVTAARRRELAALTRRLAPVLAEARRSLAALRALAGPLSPALARLAPAGAPLAQGLQRLRAILPQVSGLVGQLGALERRGREPLRLMVAGTAGISRRMRALEPVARQLTGLARLLDRYKGGAAQLADTFSGVFSPQDRGGPYGQVDVLGFEPVKPENFGYPPGAASTPAGRRALHARVATALEGLCRRGSLGACIARFNIPGLLPRPLTGGGRR